MLAALLIMLAAWVTLLLAIPIQRLLGITGLSVVSRMVGILLAALAVLQVLVGENGSRVAQTGIHPDAKEGQIRLVEVGGCLEFAETLERNPAVPGAECVSEIVENLHGGARCVEL